MVDYNSDYFRTFAERLISFDYIDATREPERLAALDGFCAPAFLDRLKGGYFAFLDETLAEIERRAPIEHLASLSPRNRDVAHTLLTREKLLLDPFSGQWRVTTRCIGREAYWFESASGEGCIVAQYGFTFSPTGDTTYIFPDRGVAVFFGEFVARSDVAREAGELARNLAAWPARAAELVANREPAVYVACAEMKAPHFGHYVWNALSAWGAILPPFESRIDCFIGWRENNYFAPVTEIFPGLGAERIGIVRTDAEFLNLLQKSGALACFPKDDHITEDLARAVVEWAFRSCPPERLAALRALKAQSQPLCLFSIRLGNRIWLEQREGFVSLARALRERFPKVGFLIDGLSAGKTMGWTHSLMSVDEEVTLARALVEDISQFAPCLSLVGETMEESVVGVDLCDFFVAPAGSGLAKSKWISNKPGVVVSNRSVLDRSDPDGWAVRVFEEKRDQIIPSVFLDKDDVVDVACSDRPEKVHNSFHLDWRIILSAIERHETELCPRALCS
ncbi:hypothetical protein [Methylocystis parvus]|uniref:Uncharacterized protein n=1 Tax=Methylocystis parvus TaxID=134 RepID=A0A6B8M7P5_9HYPH|nr:hypothetical protein [Methylocystis parvus]QGM98821.1 hypothetical protein F7D14_15905 [Methylocystis parvus]WBK00829.1 hypothetical protein MMG94_03650 [Methylocystis parvus OBBP]